jgi:aerobic-type carbon monoxide dehydrogenase small subunit (CoxS/CutS family)
MEEGRWMEAPDLLERVQAAYSKAISTLELMEEGKATRVQAAIVVHDVLFCTMCFGYMPPIRETSILTSLQRPSFEGCAHPSCQHKATCKGNRVFQTAKGEACFWRGGEEAGLR